MNISPPHLYLCLDSFFLLVGIVNSLLYCEGLSRPFIDAFFYFAERALTQNFSYIILAHEFHDFSSSITSSSTVAARYHSLAERPQFYKKIKVLVLDWQFITPQDRDPLVRRLKSGAVIQTDFRVTLICFDWAMLWGFERVLFSGSNSPIRHVILSQ